MTDADGGAARRCTRVAHRFLLGSLALLTAACGGSKSSGAPHKTFRIAMIARNSTSPLFLSARSGAEAAAAELSKSMDIEIRIEWLSPSTEDAAVQVQRIAQAVNEGVNAILVSASDPARLSRAIDDAVGRGVPVMMFDSDAPQSRRFAFYGADDLELGHQLMSELATQLNGKGKVAILAGNHNAPDLQRRVQGVKEEVTTYPGISIVNTLHNVETSQEAAAEVVRVQAANRDLRGWAMIGGWALFSPALLRDLDPNKTKIVAVDALPAQLPYVASGLAPVLLARPAYLWGDVSVRTIIDHVYLKKDVPSYVKMELVRVSKDNLGEWARQLKTWGFTDVEQRFIDLPN